VVAAALYFREAAETKVRGFSCCPSLLWTDLELPHSKPVPYSVLHGICGPFFIIISNCFLFCFVTSYFSPLSAPSRTKEDTDHWPPSLKLKLIIYNLEQHVTGYFFQHITSAINSALNFKI
jgi:hypothetical protein